MSNQPTPNGRVGAGAASRGGGAGPQTAETLQVLIDQVATFNVFIIPDQADAAVRTREGVAGFRCGANLHRFDIDLELAAGSCVKAANVVGEAEGRVELRWLFIPNDFAARPDVEPPPTRFDTGRSQRFAMQETTFTFGGGRDGFRSFGTGRTFPFWCDGRPRVVAAAVGTVTEGFGSFAGHEGTFTLCGELLPGGGFAGHVAARVIDEQGNLRTREALPPPAHAAERPDPDFTYLMWLAQKGRGPAQENRPSLTPDGQMRGLNIPMELKHGRAGFTARGAGGFRAAALEVGKVIGLEVGFGRGSQPGATPAGTPLSPFQFEGVARYRLDDPQGGTSGSITTNVLEGRRFDYRLSGAPEEQAWRFGFFGPVIYGAGCLSGFEGVFYGASNSILRPPPGDHIITHCYFARLYDPEGRLRASHGGGRR